jgi:hypothetical protein
MHQNPDHLLVDLRINGLAARIVRHDGLAFPAQTGACPQTIAPFGLKQYHKYIFTGPNRRIAPETRPHDFPDKAHL